MGALFFSPTLFVVEEPSCIRRRRRPEVNGVYVGEGGEGEAEVKLTPKLM